MLLAIAISAGVSSPADQMIRTALPSSSANAIVSEVLPPPPDKAVLQTRMFGTITVDHRAHLARRIACKNCHGPGVVSKFGALSPVVAHERCVTCHRDEKRGPTKCRECHVVPQPSIAQTTVAVAPSTATEQKVAESPSAVQARPIQPTAPAAPLASTGTEYFGAEPSDRPHDIRVLQVGYSIQGGSGSSLGGPALCVSMRQESSYLSYSLERVGAIPGGRTLGFVGGGVSSHGFRGVNILGGGVIGFDALDVMTSVVPTVGVRAGVEFPWRRMIVGIAATGAMDIVPHASDPGQRGVDRMFYLVSTSVGYVVGEN